MEGAERWVYTLEQAANELQLSKATIYRYIKDGKLRASKFGRVWRIRHEDLVQLLDNTIQGKARRKKR